MSTDQIAPPAKRQRTSSPTAPVMAEFMPPPALERTTRLSKKKSLKLADFAEHKTELKRILGELRRNCDTDYHDGYEEQGDFMQEITEEIVVWLDNIWNIMSDHSASSPGADLDVVHSCLELCSRTLKSVNKCHSRTDFSDINTDMCIKNMEEQDVFVEEHHITLAVNWAWRELLVQCEMEDHPTEDILDDLELFDIVDNVFDMLRTPEQEDDETNSSGYKFWDKHWTPEMHRASSRLVTNRDGTQMSEFMEKPSLELYRVLVTPTLKPILLDTVRKSIFKEGWPSITPSDALEIFEQNSLTEDIMSMVKQGRLYDGACCRKATRYLSKEESAPCRAAGLDLLRIGLLAARQGVWDELGTVFPDLDDAREWLDEVIEKTKVPKELLHRSKLDKTLDNVVEKFAEKARGSRRDFGYGDEEDPEEWMRHCHSDDSNSDRDFEMPREEDRFPRLGQNICDWVQVLDEWPDRTEAATLWDKVRWSDGVSDPFGMSGAMESLSYACGDNKSYLVDGMRAMVVTFSCPDLDTLEASLPRTNIPGGGKGARTVPMNW